MLHTVFVIIFVQYKLYHTTLHFPVWYVLKFNSIRIVRFRNVVSQSIGKQCQIFILDNKLHRKSHL